MLLANEKLGLSPEQANWAANVSGGHIGRARHLASQDAARQKRATALRLPGLVYEGAGAYHEFITELVKTATEEAAASVADRDAREVAELRKRLGVGAKGRGVAKAQVGSVGQIKELEKEQKNRRPGSSGVSWTWR